MIAVTIVRIGGAGLGFNSAVISLASARER
jgi:hypothetical protein